MTTRRDFLSAAAAAVLAGCGDTEVLRLLPSMPRDASAPPLGDARPTNPDAQQADAGSPPDADPPDARFEPDAEEQDAGFIETPENLPESEEFRLGVASGDVTTSTAVLWTRYDGSGALTLIVWESATDRVVASAPVTPADGGFVHREVAGLSPGERYRYAFSTAADRSPIGNFRAALAPDALEPVIFGATACNSNGIDKRTLEQAGKRTDLDAFILLGDTTYNDDARTLPEYRDKWAQAMHEDGYRAVRAATSLLMTWDDHEVVNNFSGETVDMGRLAIGRQVYFENLPLRRQPESPERIWKSVRWGRTAEVFVLDCRSERKPSTRRESNAEYISRQQMEWLKSGLRSSPAVFKLILSSVPIADLPIAFDLAVDDRWQGYEAQRREILEFIDSEPIAGVVWLGGDIHLAYCGRVAMSGPGSQQLEILAGPGAQIPNPLAATVRARVQQFDWASGMNNYLALHLDPATRQVRAVHHDRDDAVINDRTYTLP